MAKKRVKVQGADELVANLHALGAAVEEVAEDAVAEAVAYLREESVARCPVDTSDLEKCHDWKVKTFKNLGKTVGYVYINDDLMDHSSEHDVPTSQYGFYVHEAMEPFGHIQRGPATIAKDGSSQYLVGGKFMERATLENEDQVNNIIAARLREAFKKCSR